MRQALYIFSNKCDREQFVVLTIGIPEHLQNRMDIAVTVVGWIGFYVVFQNIVKGFQRVSPQGFW
jgi:hypothetical protein